jgi:hypothetical protein
MLTPALTVPNVFANGQVIDAGQINDDFTALLNWVNNNGRIGIGSNFTIFVAGLGGSNTNSGLTFDKPLATITAAYTLLQSSYIFLNGTAVVTIAVGAALSENVLIDGLVPGQQQPAQVVIQGNPSAPHTSGLNGDPCFYVDHGSLVTIRGFSLGGGSDGIFSYHGSIVNFDSIEFGACNLQHLEAQGGGRINSSGAYTIVGNCHAHAVAYGGGAEIWITNVWRDPVHETPPTGPTVTISGAVTWNGAMIQAISLGRVNIAGTFFHWDGTGGGVTGQRYFASENGVIETGTSGTLVLPGTLVGSTRNGGVYW